jgi:hypothetical protein
VRQKPGLDEWRWLVEAVRVLEITESIRVRDWVIASTGDLDVQSLLDRLRDSTAISVEADGGCVLVVVFRSAPVILRQQGS